MDKIECMYSTHEIAQSFIEDVKSVEEFLPHEKEDTQKQNFTN